MWKIWIAMAAAAALLLYLHITRHFNYWKKLNIPFIKPVPFLGNMYKVVTLRYSLSQLLQELYNSSNSSCVGFFVFDKPFLLIRDPALVKHVLIKDFEYFENRTFVPSDHDKLAENLLFAVKNPKWKHIRPKISPIFTTGKIIRMLPLLLEASEGLKGYLRDVAVHTEATEVREAVLKYTMDVISSCAFGINAECFKNQDAPFRLAANRALNNSSVTRSMVMIAYFLAPLLVKILKVNFIESVASEFFSKVFWQHMSERESSKCQRGDLVDLLLELKKNGDLDDIVLLGQAVQFLLAGYETTGTTLTFALYSLAMNPNIQDKLRCEMKEVLEQHGRITYECLKEMKFLDNIINETMRMYPVLPYLDRRCTKDYNLPGTNAIIKKGIPIYISLLGLHNDPQYFPNPDKFDPDRFKDDHKMRLTNYMPFGDGPRNCIGSRFALLSMKVALVQVLTEFKVVPCATTPKTLKLDPKGVFLGPLDGKLQLRFMKYDNVKN